MWAYGIKWPSIAEDSEILRQRIAGEIRIRVLRRNILSWLDMLEQAA